MPESRTRTRLLTTAGLATAGLVLATTGGAVAASMVTGKQIKNGTVTGADVKNHSLGAGELGKSAARVQGYKLVTRQKSFAPGSTTDYVTVNCPDGLKVLGTGAYWEKSNVGPQIYIASPSQVRVFSDNNSSSYDSLHAQAVCGRG